MTAQYLELDDRLHFTLTGEKCRVVETTHGSITLRWPSGDRIAYATNDGIWQHFTKLSQNGKTDPCHCEHDWTVKGYSPPVPWGTFSVPPEVDAPEFVFWVCTKCGEESMEEFNLR